MYNKKNNVIKLFVVCRLLCNSAYLLLCHIDMWNVKSQINHCLFYLEISIYNYL